MSFPVQSLDKETIGDSIPLTSTEKARRTELEAVVRSGLETFLQVGEALAEIRRSRLFRCQYIDFASYVKAEFGLGRSTADQIVRSAETAKSLIESGCALPATVTESVIRPLTTFEDSDLQASLWQLAEAFGPARGPTSRLVSKLCHVVRDCLDNPYDDIASEPDAKPPSKREGIHLGPREKKPASEPEVPFVRPLLRLSSWEGFSIDVVVLYANRIDNAKSLYHAAGVMRERCTLVQERLALSFPEVASA